MGGLRKILYAIVLVGALSVVSGCNTSGCLENRSSVPLAGFYSGSDSSAIALDSVSITGVDAPDGAPLYESGERLTKVYLPMRSTHQSTSWVFSYKYKALDNPAYNDTITFDYTSAPYFSSEECGVVYKYMITGMHCTHHLIEAVEITDSLVLNTDVERIKIYMRTE